MPAFEQLSRILFKRDMPVIRFPAVFFSVVFLSLVWSVPVTGYQIEEKVIEHTLGNGMRILILPRSQSPVVSLSMRFLVGAADEPQGRSGMAHLLEHMMFKGTRRLGTTDYRREEPILLRMDEVAHRLDALSLEKERAGERPGLDGEIQKLREEMGRLQAEHKKYVVKDEIDNIYTRNGGRGFNASTGVDITTYKIDLPANRLELWAKIESDRMQNPVLREFYSERDVVMEERRQSYDSQPNRLLMELFLATAYKAHPYGRPVIGWMSDLKYLPREETEAFFKRYYTPGNAILAVVGDVDPQEVISLMEKYFGPLPSSSTPPGVITREPPQRGERRAYLMEEANPMLITGYHKPTLPHRDDYVLDLIDGLLSDGRTSRLYRRLVEEEKAAVSVHTSNGLPGSRYDNIFAIIAIPLSPRSPEEVEELINEELERLKFEKVPEEELRKIKKRMEADFIRRLNSNSGLASMLSYFEALAGDWRYITRHTEIMESISPGEIMDVAQRYFTERNRTAAILKRPENGR
jgi:predicted Zn-dependent peptidase